MIPLIVQLKVKATIKTTFYGPQVNIFVVLMSDENHKLSKGKSENVKID